MPTMPATHIKILFDCRMPLPNINGGHFFYQYIDCRNDDLLFLFFSVNGDFFYRSRAQNYSQCDHLRINYNWYWINFIYMEFQTALIFNILGLGIGAGIILAIIYLYKKIRGLEGMGLGDAKLFAVVGIWFGWQGCLIILFLSSFMGSAVGIIGILNNKVSMKQQLPFAPFIVLASLLFYFNKEWIFDLLLIYF